MYVFYELRLLGIDGQHAMYQLEYESKCKMPP